MAQSPIALIDEEDLKCGFKKSQRMKRMDKLALPLPAGFNGFESVVVFGQEEGGVGINLSCIGEILTCAHCLGDEPEVGVEKIIVFTSGLVCLAVSTHVDIRMDTAMMKITGICKSNGTVSPILENFPFSNIFAGDIIRMNTPLICVGMPAKLRNAKDVEVSEGRFIGTLEGDINDNSDIGKLIHDCWTYYGHSGAPLFDRNGDVVGIHSSWDSKTGNRHGIHFLALQSFVGPILGRKPAKARGTLSASIRQSEQPKKPKHTRVERIIGDGGSNGGAIVIDLTGEEEAELIFLN
jgi:S1-C subfamily serine protease